jgi:tetratricopeptide (TPR) repeat protein
MKKDSGFYALVLVVLLLLLWSYSNHFHNPFQFDDDHTIVSNNYIRDIKNIPLFFKDARTTSSLPASQAYRPGLTTLNAIDYRIAGKSDPDPFYFHVSIFISYVVLAVLLFSFFLNIFKKSLTSEWNKYIALFASAFFCLHAANAETINYIIARSDSFSTLMVVMALVIFISKPTWRSKYIYLIPVIIGLFVKEPVVMFGPLLFIYIVLFEQDLSLLQIVKAEYRQQFRKAFLIVLPSLLLAIVYFYFSKKMTPPTWSSGGGEWYYYLITQPFVIVHYINNFLLPFSLSADTDWELVRNAFDDRVLVGVLIIAGLISSAILFSKNKATRPITFGLLWFFIALVPTSSIFPLAEVLNDHRPFLGYIGLAMALVWSAALIGNRYLTNFNSSAPIRGLILSSAIIILCVHAYGTHRRNKVWSSGESLWYDVSVKSPKNARGLMNYGNSQMAKGNYAVAQDYYERALKLWPAYSYLYINMGVLKGAMGNQQEAEQNFSKALSLNSTIPEAYYHYANYLKTQGKIKEAKEIILKGLTISPSHIANKRLYDELVGLEASGGDRSTAMEQKVKSDPSPENYLNLSLVYYNQREYEKCIEASQTALKLRPAFAEAYNNICSAYNLLGKYEEAIKAAKEALRINPGFELAKNNLNDAQQRKSKEDEMLLIVKQKSTAENYINLSLFYYNNGNFIKCVEAAKEAVKIKPGLDVAYNNICSAYNSLRLWDKAIEAGEKGLTINPDNQLLKNNLAVSKQGKQTQAN